MPSLRWLTVVTVLIYLFMLAPVIIVIAVSFNPSTSLIFPPPSLSLRWYVEFARSPLFVKAFGMSMVLGLVCALGAVLLAVPAAYALVRYDFPGKGALEALLLSPLFIPTVVVGVSLLIVFSRLKLQGSFLSLVLAHILLTVPYVVRTVTASLSGADVRVEEAAAILGASPLLTFFRVTLPLMSSGVFAGALFAFVTSFGELNTSIFLVGPRTVTLPVQVFSYLQWNTSPIVASVSAVQVGLVLLMAWAIERVFGLSKALTL